MTTKPKKAPSLAEFLVKSADGAPKAAAPKAAREAKRKNLSLRLTHAQWRRVANLAMDLDLSVQELAVRGLSSLFTERGLPPLD